MGGRVSREHIVAEIRRCAEDNDGRPLGRERFFAASGIRDADVSRHWLRWNDAIAEAGYAPNALQSRMDDDVLLGHLAGLVRDLGHVPVNNELRHRARADPSFPSTNTFARFGGKASVIARLHEYATADPDLADVAAICAAAMPSAQTPADADRPIDVETTGYVYLIKSGRHYKIGRSNSTGRRSYEIALQLPERATLVHEIATDDPAGIEAYWHRRFADRRANGEWFRLTPVDVAAFKRRRNFM